MKKLKNIVNNYCHNGDLTTSLGYKNHDNIEITIKTIIEKVIQEKSISENEGILQNVENVNLIPSNIELETLEISLIKSMKRESILKDYVDKVRENYDYILIDCRPSLGLLTINALVAADSVIIPVQAHYLPIKGMEQLIKTIDKTRVQINPNLKIQGILLTIADMKTNLAKTTIETLKNNYGKRIKVYDTVIPMGVKAAESTIEGKSIYAYDKRSKLAVAYENFTEEVLKNSQKIRTRADQCR